MPIPIPEKRYLLGVDLAKTFDFTSFAVIEMIRPLKDNPKREYVYHLRALDRIKGVEYPAIVELIISTIKRLDREPEVKDGPHLAFDASGLGSPIKDYLKAAHVFNVRRRLYPVVFTGGERAKFDTETFNYNISKSLIFSNLLSLMQQRRFDYASDLQALPQLEEEIAAFKYHLTASGHTTMDAAQGKHDDLLCAIAIPLIIAEWQFVKRVIKAGPKPAGM